MTKGKALLSVGALLMGVAALVLLATPSSIPVDIKPGSYPNCMDRDSKGVVSVGLDNPASTNPNDIELNDQFDCTTTTATALRCKVEDIPGFGDSSDLVCQFSSSDLRTAGVMPAAGTCQIVNVCVNNVIVGQDRLCEAHSSTCSGAPPEE